ncbi:endonuclease/exonuclease/phosphatase family protein [Gracilibacillus dipsosauri]|uniref:endonuclease/exonuclease/phosphatase family protein n=1 Tax=Gracilibacillus dipsosauri TaxID=178340 RepID=UPI00240A34CF
MKKGVVCLLLSMFLVIVFSSSVAATGKGKEVNLKVMSFNIHHGEGLDGELDIKRTAKVMKDTGAEIIGIQEVDRFYGDRSDFQDQARKLAKLLGYHYVFGANLNLEPETSNKNRQYGTAVLSKYPIIDSENIHLSSFGNEQRGLLRTKINVKGIHVHFYNTHLGLNVAERLAQIAEINEVKSSFSGPSVLVGDLNAEPDSKELQLLLQEGNLVDVFANGDESNTFPVINPTKRIDYILTSPSVYHLDSQVIYTEASDHLPIVADIVITR